MEAETGHPSSGRDARSARVARPRAVRESLGMAKLPSRLETPSSEYEVVCVRGEGGAGRVYEATSDTGERVAIKVLVAGTADKQRRFRNEISFCERSNHQNIVRVLDTGFVRVGDDKLLFYVMPLFESTLRTLMAESLAPDVGLGLFSQLLHGVEAAHLKGVVHRDLKPENVLFDEAGDSLVVADFGVARFSEEALLTLVETKDGQRLANFQYAAPEQRTKGGDVGAPADVYALGLMLNEMFTGEVPLGTDYKTIDVVYPELAYLDSLVREMIRQAPAARLQTIEHVKRVLIGHKNEFVARQELDDAKREVVPAAEVSDLLVERPVAMEGHDYRDGEIWVTLNYDLNKLGLRGERWKECFYSPDGGFSSLSSGMSPKACILGATTVRFPAREQTATDHFELFVQYLASANRRYAIETARRVREKEQFERQQMAEEVQRAEERVRVLAKLKPQS